MCLWVGLFGFLLLGTLSASWICVIFFHQIREVFHHCFFKHVLYSLLLLFSFWHPYYMYIVMFHVVLQLPYHLFFLSESLFLLLLLLCFFSTMSSSSLIQSSSSVHLLVITSSVCVFFFFLRLMSIFSWFFFYFLFPFSYCCSSHSVSCTCPWVPWASL